jgi:hypothetical protein
MALQSPECTFPFRGFPPKRPAASSAPASLIPSGRASARSPSLSPQAASPLFQAVDRRERAVDPYFAASIERQIIDPYFAPSIDRRPIDPYFGPSINRQPIYPYFTPSIDIRPIDPYFGLSILIWPIYPYFTLSILISRHRSIDGSSILILGHLSLFWAVDPYFGLFKGRAVYRPVLSSGYKTPRKV